jgi:MOSC domain-containing protein YiiM
MQLISVNVGKPLPIKAKSGVTGIYKLPQSGPVQIGWLGLEGDAICDTENHGGRDQAVYVYGTTDYDWWSKELGRTLEPGTFGENLTISELESTRFAAGDQLRVGAVLLEVTFPRVPCVTLATRMGDPKFVKRFRYAERPGLYCRVLVPGEVSAGAPVRVELTRDDTLTMRDMFRQFYEKNPG